MNKFSLPLIEAKGIHKSYGESLQVLKNVDLVIQEGDAICIMGASGAGKSTLLHILGTLDKPTQGEVFFKGSRLSEKSDNELSRFRNRAMGFVFQFHYLLKEFNALENVMMPCRIAGLSERESRKKAEELLVDLGLQNRMTHHPSEMSGGEQQRVAIARALSMRPDILFADEPTGNLDSQNTMKIQELFFALKRKYNLTLVVVSHDIDFAKKFPKVYKLRDGQWSR